MIQPGLHVLFCGINPGLYSAAAGHHFARPGNRFWPTLHAAGFTDRLLAAAEDTTLLEYGCGLTNLVARSTASAAELDTAELVRGRQELEAKIARFAPQYLAVLGIGAYRVAFKQPTAVLGKQPNQIGTTILWVLPNPSGLNAHYPQPELARQFRLLRERRE